ncbi:hypothetical protein BP6252_00424 [Coleophoma cylindrospora]|uniref:2EXR domain-containing protein n=1 Tax=Coleophoma cylindrospora TaxID=1849047 RepID=A0A3D8SQ22_9HELO|nr:hypothetical protein BP6252_00424 [Coleophoma cylindrospora]
MVSPTKFTIFSELPIELRLKIWESVPQPERIIEQLPCSHYRDAPQGLQNEIRGVRQRCAAHGRADWHLRCVGNSKHDAIFPPLHACRQSRAVWLPRYFSPPRYLDLPCDNTQQYVDSEGVKIHRLLFDVPFVSYEKDVFAVLDTLSSFLGFDVDPFLGFDRQLIQNVAISENAWYVVQAMAAVKPQSLPRLQTVSVLVLGPEPGMSGSVASGWYEMAAADIQRVDCDVRDISDKLVTDHPLFGKSRLRHLTFAPDPKLRPLVNYLKMFKAWLWHGSHWDDHETRMLTDFEWWDFNNYVFREDIDLCPLRNLPGWCPGHHSKDEMLNWSGGCTVQVKLLVERKCMAELTASSAFEIDSDGNYGHFAQFMKERTSDLELVREVLK